jgi:hypothetical protein
VSPFQEREELCQQDGVMEKAPFPPTFSPLFPPIRTPVLIALLRPLEGPEFLGGTMELERSGPTLCPVKESSSGRLLFSLTLRVNIKRPHQGRTREEASYLEGEAGYKSVD